MNATPPLRVADVFRAHWDDYLRDHSVPVFQQIAIRHILLCRTPALGGHLWQCSTCGHQAVLYNSCRDRHCPTCQGIARDEWLAKRMKELLPVPYFHVVFTLPHSLNPLIRYNRKKLIDLFFREVNATFQEFSLDPQWRLEGQLGFIAILHTWTQELREHIHLHCAVPGGALRAAAKPPGEDGRAAAKPPGEDGRNDTHTWVPTKRNWLFRESSLAERFRTRYLRAVSRLLKRDQLILPDAPEDWPAVCTKLAQTKWIVYAKKPFAGPRQVFEYLGRYTHKVAISDYRIRKLGNGTVTFRYRDRAAGDIEKETSIPAADFIRRFLLHILPPGLQKIRYLGWMGRNVRKYNLSCIRQALGIPIPRPEPPVLPPCPTCPSCGKASMMRLLIIGKARAPPERT
ncbi:MAG: IS91 family transposase [Kiritimatiellae bacterium]|nr:IS91 family transposase [Kiritimatiellia bacterium]